MDGTLFLTDDPLAGTALRATLQARFRVDLPEDAVEQADHRGQTALRIGRLVLRGRAWSTTRSTRGSETGASGSPDAM